MDKTRHGAYAPSYKYNDVLTKDTEKQLLSLSGTIEERFMKLQELYLSQKEVIKELRDKVTENRVKQRLKEEEPEEDIKIKLNSIETKLNEIEMLCEALCRHLGV